MSDKDANMPPADSAVGQTRPPTASSYESDKRRAVAGAERAVVDDMTHDIAFYKQRLADETARCKHVERAFLAAQQAAANTEQIASDTVQLEVQQYIAEYEAACRIHIEKKEQALQASFREDEARLVSQLAGTEHTVMELENSLQQAKQTLETQHQQLDSDSKTLAAQEHQAQRDIAQRLGNVEANLEAQKVAYKKDMIAKSNEIAGLMAKLRTAPTSITAVQENFPATVPPLVPRFISHPVRKGRALKKVVKTATNRLPVLPLQLAADGLSTSHTAEQVRGFDPTDNNSDAQVAKVVKQIMASMGIFEVVVAKNNKRGPSQMTAAVNAQKAVLTSEQDRLYKSGLREVWRKTYGFDTAEEFRHYQPVDARLASVCDDGGEGPAASDYSLDFGEAYESSRWNHTVIAKLVGGFQAARTASSDGWGLPAVTNEYLEGLLYGHLKRSQQAWALWRPRFLRLAMKMETEAEAIARAEAYLAKRQVSVGSRSCHDNKHARRLEIIERMIVMKTNQSAPDLAIWTYFKTVVEHLDIDGMSSEDPEVAVLEGKPINVYRVRLCSWRAQPITEYLRMIDDAGQQSQKTNAGPRIRNGGEGRRAPPKGLPRKMYDEQWLAAQHPSYIEELEISQEAFQFLVAATTSM
ncbi:hypothetical protein K438DRAFT_1766304 [Mycena galopus ATCC 62051]|nr:hypothetical protein K438DRAFT_1766304 [Mycena galopus ATCC 62051]